MKWHYLQIRFNRSHIAIITTRIPPKYQGSKEAVIYRASRPNTGGITQMPT